MKPLFTIPKDTKELLEPQAAVFSEDAVRYGANMLGAVVILQIWNSWVLAIGYTLLTVGWTWFQWNAWKSALAQHLPVYPHRHIPLLTIGAVACCWPIIAMNLPVALAVLFSLFLSPLIIQATWFIYNRRFCMEPSKGWDLRRWLNTRGLMLTPAVQEEHDTLHLWEKADYDKIKIPESIKVQWAETILTKELPALLKQGEPLPNNELLADLVQYNKKLTLDPKWIELRQTQSNLGQALSIYIQDTAGSATPT